MRLSRSAAIGLVAFGILFFALIVTLLGVSADAKPTVQLNTEKAAPRQVDDAVRQAIARDYSAAWQAMSEALAKNNPSVLNEYFAGFALEKTSGRIRDQRANNLTTRLIDHGHNVEAVFYSPDGSAMELRDTASIETQILDGSTVIHSDRSQITYYAIMTGAEDHWKVRVLESVPAKVD